MRSGVLFLASILALSSNLAHAQNTTGSSSSERKIASRVRPVYPELAKRMHIHGAVRMEVIVRPNGSVKSSRVLGGNPVLVEAAQEAVGKWRFEATQSETTEIVQLAFESGQ